MLVWLPAGCPAPGTPQPAACADQDRDGACVEVDCDDTNPASNPGASELWCDDVDQACDGGDDFVPGLPGSLRLRSFRADRGPRPARRPPTSILQGGSRCRACWEASDFDPPERIEVPDLPGSLRLRSSRADRGPRPARRPSTSILQGGSRCRACWEASDLDPPERIEVPGLADAIVNSAAVY